MQSVLAFGLPGGSEWIIVLVVAVLIFGRRLPEIARGVGKSVTEFKKGIKEAQTEVTDAVDDAASDDRLQPRGLGLFHQLVALNRGGRLPRGTFSARRTSTSRP